MKQEHILEALEEELSVYRDNTRTNPTGWGAILVEALEEGDNMISCISSIVAPWVDDDMAAKAVSEYKRMSIKPDEHNRRKQIAKSFAILSRQGTYNHPAGRCALELLRPLITCIILDSEG